MRICTNSRLETLQAAILPEKPAICADELVARNAVAARYTSALHNRFKTPHGPEEYGSVWAQFWPQALSGDVRIVAMVRLNGTDYPKLDCYRRPLHTQSVYATFPIYLNALDLSEGMA